MMDTDPMKLHRRLCVVIIKIVMIPHLSVAATIRRAAIASTTPSCEWLVQVGLTVTCSN